MRLDVLDAETLARVGWVDVWVSFYWDSPYYSEGGFTLEVRPTTENLQLLQEGRKLPGNPRLIRRLDAKQRLTLDVLIDRPWEGIIAGRLSLGDGA